MKLSIVTIVVLSALSTATYAEGFYAGAAIGQSYSNLCPSLDKSLATGYSCANGADAFDIAGGYNFTPNVGIEVNYEVLGTYAAYHGVTSAVSSATYGSKANAFIVAATGNLELAYHISLIGKLGIANISVDQQTATASNSSNNTNAIYGLGLQYDFSKSVAGRALWENLGWIGSDSIMGSQISMVSLGLIYKFY